jgi:hypothetical protein
MALVACGAAVMSHVIWPRTYSHGHSNVCVRVPSGNHSIASKTRLERGLNSWQSHLIVVHHKDCIVDLIPDERIEARLRDGGRRHTARYFDWLAQPGNGVDVKHNEDVGVQAERNISIEKILGKHAFGRPINSTSHNAHLDE